MTRLVNERDLLHRANLAGYTLVDFELNGHRSSLTINCPACGTIRTVNYTRFKYKSNCLVCLANNNRLSKNDILTVINRLGYEILSFGEGQGQKQQLAVRCTTCGKQREVTYKAVISKPFETYMVGEKPLINEHMIAVDSDLRVSVDGILVAQTKDLI